MLDSDNLRALLRDFRTRSATIDEAVHAGEEAIEPAIGLLQDRNEATRWSAVQILSEIGDERAVEPLLKLMERGKHRVAAANALRQITGKDCGDDVAEWRKTLGAPGASGPATERTELSDEELVRAATRDMDATLSGQGQRYAVQVRLDNGRRQQVYIDFGSKDAERAPLVRMYTLCGKADPARYEWALKNNMRLPYGAIGIATLEGKPCFAMVDAYLRATADPEDVAKSILNLAANGDMVEKVLTRKDNY
jgi:hypothetical protein